MSLDAIKQIAQAEQQTVQRRTEAQAQARRIIADAERAGQETLDAARAQARTQTEQLCKEARAKAEKRAKAVLDETAQTCDAMRKAAKGKLPAVAKVIVERVVNR